MIASLVMLAVVGTADPRISLTQLQLDGRQAETLGAVEKLLEESPDQASDLGLHYLRGHLLEELGRSQDAHEAFAHSMGTHPSLASYGRYRLALNQTAQGHPEVAAGLLAAMLSGGPPAALLRPGVELFLRTLQSGGDCRLLGRLDSWKLPEPELRRLQIARADCEMRDGKRESATNRLLALLRANAEDEPARNAAVRLDAMRDTVRPDQAIALIIGRVFHRHRQFGLSITYLRRSLTPTGSGSATALNEEIQDPDTHYALARSYFWQEEYLIAASHFGRIAAASHGEDKARALYQQGRCYELSGNWNAASQSYRIGYLEDPEGRWADAALVSAFRVEWRSGREDSALELYEVLGSRREWRQLYSRAALFLASSEVSRGRAHRVERWLEQGLAADRSSEPEIAYWAGRLAELQGEPESAVTNYLAVLTAAPFDPFAQAARVRLAEPELGSFAEGLGTRLAAAGDLSSLYQAWTLLGDQDPRGTEAGQRLADGLARLRQPREYLQLALEPTTEWPMWQTALRQPEEQLMALGIWREGSKAIRKHFPLANASLALTGSTLLSQAGAHRDSLRIAEILGERATDEVPDKLLPRSFRELLYPLPYSRSILTQAQQHNVDPFLLSGLIREESRFDRHATSAASARGLTQFVLPTAKRLAPVIGQRSIEGDDLHDPDVSIALGAAYLAELAQRFDNRAPIVISAYNAGERQAELWRSYCYSRDAAEFLSKVGFPETRAYLRRVLSSRAQYQDLYGAVGNPDLN